MLDRDTLLHEMGIPVWRLRAYRGALLKGQSATPLGVATAQAGYPAVPDAASAPESAHNFQKTRDRAAGGNPAAAPSDFLQDETLAAWTDLEREIHACNACGLCRQRRQAVPGTGDRQADWLFIGEGPGAEEDERGEPFVGQAGKLLDAMLASIGLKRGEGVYIANAVKCRPPGNRTPEAGEMAACRPFLVRQVALIRPRLIVLLGRAAAHSVLGGDDALSSLRGRRHAFGEVPVLVTYHPAYLLRTPLDKAKAWEDLCLARRTMRELPPRAAA